MDHPVTILQIAEESGVSTATVSRVINGTAPVSQATRDRVNAVIQRHACTPNIFARSLISRRSMTIGIIMPDISNPCFSAMFQEIEEAARAARYSVFLCNTSFRASTAHETELRELEGFQMMLDKKVDGVLVAGGQADLLQVSDAYKAGLRRLSSLVPVVVLGSPIDGVDCLFIQRERGEGVSVISCDQFFSADYFVPRLTSVDQHNELFGRLIINALLGVMSGEPKEAVLTCGPELVVRESCAPPCAAM